MSLYRQNIVKPDNKHQSVRLGNVFVCVHCSYVSAREQLQEIKEPVKKRLAATVIIMKTNTCINTLYFHKTR